MPVKAAPPAPPAPLRAAPGQVATWTVALPPAARRPAGSPARAWPRSPLRKALRRLEPIPVMHPSKTVASGALKFPVEFPLHDDLLDRLSKQLHAPPALPHFAPPEPPAAPLAATAWDRPGGAAMPPAAAPPAQQPTHVNVDSIDNTRLRPSDFPKAQLTDVQTRNLPQFNLAGDREVGRQFFKALATENRVFQNPVDHTKFVLRGPARELLRVYDQALNQVNERWAGRGEQPLVGGVVHQAAGTPPGLTVAASRDRAALQQEAHRAPGAAFPPGRIAASLEQAAAAGKAVPPRTVEALLAEYTKPTGQGRPASATELSTVIASADKLARTLSPEHPLRAAVNEKSLQLSRDLSVLAGGRDAASGLVSESISRISTQQRDNAANAARSQLGESFKQPQQQAAQQKQPAAGRDFER